MVVFALLAMFLAGIGVKATSKRQLWTGGQLRQDESIVVCSYLVLLQTDKYDSSSLVTRLTSDATIIQNALSQMGTRPFMRDFNWRWSWAWLWHLL